MTHRFEESAFLYLTKSILDFDGDRLTINQPSPPKDFDLYVSYSYDAKNYTQFVPYPTKIKSEANIPVYVCIWCRRKVYDDLERINAIPFRQQLDLQHQNVFRHSEANSFPHNTKVSIDTAQCVISDIRYNDEIVEFKAKQHFDVIDEFPRWNFYDRQQVNIMNWLASCNAISESYGHTVIYFKTDPSQEERFDNQPNRKDAKQSGIHGTHHILSNNVIRNVTEIKKLHVMLPNNELPQDRVAFTDWDIALQEDFLIHIVREKFEQAFGRDSIPNEKDFIYFPLINKMFRVSTMQPKNGFMGVIGWYEVFMQKWEDDDHVVLNRKDIPNDLRQSFLSSSDNGFFDIIGDQPEYSEIEAQLDNYLGDQDFIDPEESIKEEAIATNNLSNRLVDSTGFVSIKSTEKYRELYDKRLKIVSVNPDQTATTPIMLYDCNIEKTPNENKTIMKYSIDPRTIEKYIQLTFDYILLGRYNGTILDTNVFSISIKNRMLYIFDKFTQQSFEIIEDAKLNMKEYYQIGIERISTTTESIINTQMKSIDVSGQIVPDTSPYFEGYAFKIYQLFEGSKCLVYQNVWFMSESPLIKSQLLQELHPIESRPKSMSDIFKTTEMYIHSGNCYLGNILMKADDSIILEDKCLPLLKLQQF